MIKIDIRTNLPEIARRFELGVTRRARYAAAATLTRTANKVRDALYQEMREVFDRPTNFTLRSLFVRPAKRDRLVSEVWLKDDYDARRKHYLLPQIYSGARVAKRFEFMLRRIGVLPDGMVAVPGSSASKDAHGNMSRGEIVKILSYLQAFYLAGSTQNSTAETRAKMKKGSRSRKGMEYIVLKQRRGGLVPGVWRVDQGGLGRSVRPVLIFVSEATYRKRFDFYGVANRTAHDVIQTEWRKAWQEFSYIKD